MNEHLKNQLNDILQSEVVQPEMEIVQLTRFVNDSGEVTGFAVSTKRVGLPYEKVVLSTYIDRHGTEVEVTSTRIPKQAVTKFEQLCAEYPDAAHDVKDQVSVGATAAS